MANIDMKYNSMHCFMPCKQKQCHHGRVDCYQSFVVFLYHKSTHNSYD